MARMATAGSASGGTNGHAATRHPRAAMVMIAHLLPDAGREESSFVETCVKWHEEYSFEAS